MVNSSPPLSVLFPPTASPATRGAASAQRRVPIASLARAAVGATSRVSGFASMEDEMVAWLRAVGIGEGERVTVLRRAVFGGPLHVRTGAGGEFALHRSLAESILLFE